MSKANDFPFWVIIYGIGPPMNIWILQNFAEKENPKQPKRF